MQTKLFYNAHLWSSPQAMHLVSHSVGDDLLCEAIKIIVSMVCRVLLSVCLRDFNKQVTIIFTTEVICHLQLLSLFLS